MRARISSHWPDLAVTAVLFGIGVYGLVASLGFPERAQVWPVAVMTLLVVATAVHLMLTLREPSDTAETPAEGVE